MNKKLITLILASMAIGALVGCTPKKGGGSSGDGSSSGNTSSQSSDTSQTSQSSQGDELPAEYSLMKYWAGNPGEQFYDVDDSGDTTIIDYEEVTGEYAGGWAYVNRSFAYDAASISQFTEYKKISFTGKLEKTSGSDVVMIKIEGQGGATIYEQRFTFASTVKTYELSVESIADWSQVSSLLFFVNRLSEASGTGKITLSKFVLSKEEVVPANALPAPQDWNTYNGEESFNVMNSWGFNEEGFITTVKEDDKYTFSWSGVKEREWSFVSAQVRANADHPLKESGLKRAVFTIKGVADQPALLKVEDHTLGNANAKEANVTMTGEEQVVEIDITGILAHADFSGKLKLVIFPFAGQQGEVAQGSIELRNAKLDKTAVVIPEEKNAPTFGAIWMDKVAVKDPCYTVYPDNHFLTIDYAKEAKGYESLLFKIDPIQEWFLENENPKEYNRIVGKIKATVNVSVLLKPYDLNANEHWFNLVANEEQVIDFVVEKDTVDFSKAFALFICAGDAEQALTGRVMIDGLRIVRENVNVGYDGDMLLNRVLGRDGGFSSFALHDNDLIGTFAFASNGWHQIEMFISAKDATKYNELVGTIVSSVNTTLIIKPQDNYENEIKINLEAGVDYELDHKFNGKLDQNWAKVLMSVSNDEGDGLEGTITFKSLTLKINDPEMVSADPNPINYGAGFIDNYSFASDCYYLRKTAAGVKVVVGQDKAPGWENIQAQLALTEGWFGLENYTKINLDVKSTVDTNILIKPYDNGALEHGEGLTAGQTKHIEMTLDFTGKTIDFSKALIIFLGTDGMAAGEVYIEKFSLSRPETNLEAEEKIYLSKVAYAHPDNFDVEAAADGKGMTISYHKAVGQEWEGIQVIASAHDLNELKVLHLKGTASEAVHLKFKFDGPNEEKEVILSAGSFDEAITYNNQLDGKWNKILIFVAYDGGDAKTGTLTLNEFYLGK